jgi:hypothetical protein
MAMITVIVNLHSPEASSTLLLDEWWCACISSRSDDVGSSPDCSFASNFDDDWYFALVNPTWMFGWRGFLILFVSLVICDTPLVSSGEKLVKSIINVSNAGFKGFPCLGDMGL